MTKEISTMNTELIRISVPKKFWNDYHVIRQNAPSARLVMESTTQTAWVYMEMNAADRYHMLADAHSLGMTDITNTDTTSAFRALVRSARAFTRELARTRPELFDSTHK